MVTNANGRQVVWTSLFIALLLQIMPLPDLVVDFRPDWLLLVLCYWAMALPHRYGILTAWLMGVMLDILLGSSLGVRGLALAVVTYIIAIHFQRLRNFSTFQQGLVIALFSVFYHLMIFVLEQLMGGAKFTITALYPAVINAPLWIWVFWVLRDLRRHFKVR